MSGEITKPISDNTLRVLHINWMSWPEFKGGHVVHCSRLIETLSQLNTKQAYLFSGYGSSGEVPRLRKYRKKDEHVDFYQIINATGPVNIPSVDIRNPRIESIVLDVIKDYSPHLVHIHHMIGFPASTIGRIKETFNIPVVITIRDFWYICPLVQLLKVNHEICRDNSKGEGCRDCFQHITGLSPSKTGHRTWSGEFEARKTAWIRALNLADQISAVSSYIKNIYVTEGVSPNKMHVISAGVPNVLKKLDENKIASAKFKIGFLGTISTLKGVNVLLKALDQWKDPDISLELWGSLSDDDIRLQLEKNDDKRVSVFGPYESDDLTKILSNFDVGIIPSIWPDTAPQVIFEFFSMKIPVVASKIGGIPDFIYHEKNGLLFEPNNASDLLHALKRLKNDNKLLNRLSKNIKPQKSLINYAGEILLVYKKAIKINQEPNGLCVELGGGETPRKKESGFINIDYRISPQVELVANVKDLPIKNGSLEKLYCANLSEHFERSDIQKVLLEWWRVLRPGGWIDVMVPDLEGTLDNWRDIPFNRVLDALYGAQKFEGDYHFNGFTERSLKQVLYRSGFSYSSQVIKWIFDSVPRIQIRAHKKPKISLFPLGDTSIGSSRLRLHRLYPSLVKMGYKVNLFGDVKECDVAIFQKVFDRDLFKKCTGVKILDIDDNYFENGSLVHQCRAAAKSASAIVTSTPELGNIASKYSNASIYTVPTGIDVVQLDNLDIKAPQKVKLIGWVGYPENVVYLENILPVIRELSIRLRVISRRTEEVDIWLNRNADIVEFREWSILTADSFLKECDMGVAPLSNDGWAQTKSAVKILKYWALGLPVVCSPSPEYSRIEAGTGTKFIAHNQKEWKELIQSKKNVRLKQVEQAKNLLSKYSNENLSKNWSKIIQSALYDEYLKRENIKGEETNNSKFNIEDKKVQIISHRKNPDKNNGEIYSKDRILEKKSAVRYSVHENTELKRCSIIIPIYNKIELTKHCLKALYRATNPELFEVILIDNGSSDGTKKYIESLNKNVSIIYNKNNMGFARACNQGAKTSKCEYLLFLNNDTEVLQNWLEPLLKIVDRDREVVAVGSKLLFPDRTIQHAGVVVINDKKLSDPLVARHIYYGQREDLPDANRQRYYQVLTAACLLIRRERFEKVEGFDERYWNGYEDVDLCFKLQEKGWRLVYQPESVAIHHESKSGEERFKKTQENIDLLHNKWIGKITPDIIIEQDGNIKATNANHIKEYTFQNEKVALDQKQDQSAKVSIIILTLNQVEYTRKCIESLFSHTHVPFEIIVVDNGSTDETLEYLNSLKKKNSKHQKITIISNNKNLGFAGGNNLGLGVSKGNFLLLMNNDIVVTPGWLERLISCAERSPKIGIVGPMSNNVSGPQVIRNIGYNAKTLAGLETFSEKLAEVKAGESLQILRVVGFCMLIKRAVIEIIGGMDCRYGLGNFEDDDFSLRAAMAGFESWMVEDCFVHHFGSRTFIGEKIDHRKSLHNNWEIFKEKWGLPSDLPYGSPYSFSQMKINGFDPQIYYIPLSVNDENSLVNWSGSMAIVEQEYSTVCSSIDKEDLEIAIEKLQGLANKYQNFAPVYNDLGVLFFQYGDNESALKNYQKAVKLNPQNINFQKNIADLLAVTFGEFEEALQHYVTVLASDPKDVEALLATGHICARLERYDDAAEFYERVIEIEPNNSDAPNWLTKMREKVSGNNLEGNFNDRYLELLSEIDPEDLAAAIQKIEKFIELYPKNGQAHNDLGVLYYKKDNKTKALERYLKAVELEPENVTFRKNLADFLYVEEGRVEAALENYVGVLRIKPDDVEILLIVGHICVALEQFEDAISFYKRVIEIDPKNVEAGQNLDALFNKLNGQQIDTLRADESGFKDENVKNLSSEIPEGGVKNESIGLPQVSIVMVLNGSRNAIQKSYTSVRENTDMSYELILIENETGPNVRKWANEIHRKDTDCQLILSNRDGNVAEQLNRAMESARGGYIVVVRNNIQVPENWLTDMVETLDHSNDIGIVGPINKTSDAKEFSGPKSKESFRKYAQKFRAQNRHRRIPSRFIDSSCLAFKRNLVNLIGDWDTQISDDLTLIKDFCQRSTAAGYRNLIVGDVLVHFHGCRAKASCISEKTENESTCRKRFQEKWNGLTSDNPTGRQVEIQTLLENADRLFQKGQVEKGIEAILEGIRKFPEEDRIYVSLAEQLINIGRYQDALDTLEEIPVDANENKKERDHQKIKISILKAYCEEGLGNYEEAERHADQTLLIQPDNHKALNLRGILSYRKNDNKQAHDFFHRAIDADPGYGEPHTNLGSIRWKSQDTDEALKLFERGFILTPTDLEIAANYHEAVSALIEFNRAEPIVREALALYPFNKKLHYILIDILIQLGHLQEAMAQIERAISTFGIEDGILDAALKVRTQIGPDEIKERAKKRASVSLCMIVKNEEEFLAQCLNSVKPIVGEMIIVDTGSTDRTREIATVFGAQVFDLEWTNDFAGARNFSISKAKGDWILIMDADEVISPLDHDRFRKLTTKKPSGIAAYSIFTRNYCYKANTIGWNPNDGKYGQEEAANGWLSSEKVRLFSNNDGIKFEGAVHEMVDSVLKRQGIVIKKCKIPVHHYGRLNADKLNQKSRTYYEIGRIKLAESSDDIGAVRELAIQATILEKNAEAIELWQMFLALKPDDKAVSEAYVNMVTAYIRMNDYPNALTSAKKAVAFGPDLKEAQYNLAFAELLSGDAIAAIGVLKNLLQRISNYPPAEFLLSAALCCKGDNNDRNSSIKNLKESSFAPSIACSITEMAEDLMAANQVVFSFRLLQAAIDDEMINDKIMSLYAACLKRIKKLKDFGGEDCVEAEVLKTTVVCN